MIWRRRVWSVDLRLRPGLVLLLLASALLTSKAAPERKPLLDANGELVLDVSRQDEKPLPRPVDSKPKHLGPGTLNETDLIPGIDLERQRPVNHDIGKWPWEDGGWAYM
jgi:hypothetical protein